MKKKFHTPANTPPGLLARIGTFFNKSKNVKDVVRRLFSFALILSILLSPFAPISAYAETDVETTQEVLTDPVAEEEITNFDEVVSSNNESENEEITTEEVTETTIDEDKEDVVTETETEKSESTATVVEEESVEITEEVLEDSVEISASDQEVVEDPTAEILSAKLQPLTKFKKDVAKSKEAELADVRQHLQAHNISQDIVARLDAYEARQAQGPPKENFFKKIIDFVTGNTDKQKEERKVRELAKKQPFQVEGFKNGTIHTINAAEYDQFFPNQKEESPGILEKVKNFIQTGSTLNSNFDGTQEQQMPFSWLFVRDALADVSQNPADYLDEGAEIVFSQAIQDQADALGNDPLEILNFVRNDIEYVPYYGSKKGSDSTLVERAGNDTDQASLLIAMLRYSNIPARYRHVDAQMDINTVTSLLGVETALGAAEVLSLHDVPYILFVDGEQNPLFFVVEHTYVEAYIPYGYSRGVDANDGGTEQWVPMDSSFNSSSYVQLVDVLGEMKTNGFDIETFYDDYLENTYTTLGPVDAFKGEIMDYIDAETTNYEDTIYAASLVQKITPEDNLDFIPGTLPYHIAADLNTYDYVPTSLRHTVTFTVEDDQQNEILDHTAYVSDISDKELLLTYSAATPADQTTIESFDTIYDVVPLSLVAVYTQIRVNGISIATTTATTTLGQMQSYSMEFSAPAREVGESISSNSLTTIDKDFITGNTDAIALDTDRVALPELRPTEDVQTTSFVANQKLYKTAQNYLYRLEQTQQELARITGGDYSDTATRATVFNGVSVTYATSSEPYSFDWIGLRIDSSAKVRYFNRLSEDTTKYKDEFTRVFGLQASQDESDIFEDDFGVESMATVKGLKLVSDGEFGGVSLHKITSANENDIDSLTSISTTTRDIFHSAVQAGNTIYTPSAPVTYGEWTGLFYININPTTGFSAYIIGEGLNGGYSVCAISGGVLCNWSTDNTFLLTNFVQNIQATIISPLTSQFDYTDAVEFTVGCTGTVGVEEISWIETQTIDLSKLNPGSEGFTFKPRCDSGVSKNVVVTWSDVSDLLLGFIPFYSFGVLGLEGYIGDTFTSQEISDQERLFRFGVIFLSLIPEYGAMAKGMLGLARGEAGALARMEGTKFKAVGSTGQFTVHTLKKHVVSDKTVLQARAASSGNKETAFYTKEQAEKYVSEAYQAKLSEIEAWYRNNPSSTGKNFDYTIPSPIEKFGHGYAAGGTGYNDNITTVRLVTKQLQEGGHIIETAFPLYP